MSEIIFEVTEDQVDGGYSANAIGYGIHTQGDSIEEIRRNVRKAVDCYFNETMDRPGIIRLRRPPAPRKLSAWSRPLASQRPIRGSPNRSTLSGPIRTIERPWLGNLASNPFQRIGTLPVPKVTSVDGPQLLAPNWLAKPPIARVARQHIRAVLETVACVQ